MGSSESSESSESIEFVFEMIKEEEIISTDLFKITYSLYIITHQKTVPSKELEEINQKYSNLKEIDIGLFAEMDFIFDKSSNMKFNCSSGITFSLKDFADKYGLELSEGVNLSGDGINNILNIKFQGDKSSISVSIEVGINFCRVTLKHEINIDNSDKTIREEYIIESKGYCAFIIGVNLIGYFRKNQIIYGKISKQSISNFAENVVKKINPKNSTIIVFGKKIFDLIKNNWNNAVESCKRYGGTIALPEIVGFLAIGLVLLNVEAIPFVAIAGRSLI